MLGPWSILHNLGCIQLGTLGNSEKTINIIYIYLFWGYQAQMLNIRKISKEPEIPSLNAIRFGVYTKVFAINGLLHGIPWMLHGLGHC